MSKKDAKANPTAAKAFKCLQAYIKAYNSGESQKNLDKLNKRLTGVNEEDQIANNNTSAPTNNTVTENVDYKKTISEKLQLLIESAQKQTAGNNGDAQPINESVKTEVVDNTPAFIKHMPNEYIEKWSKLSESRKNEIIVESTRYNLSTDYLIANFWSTRDLRNSQVQLERINESKVAAADEKSAVNNEYLEGFKSQLEGRFAKYTKK
jgi:hypothetical protein